ncbi:hypothetical protein MSG28_004365 [Choristoneura fumiferana]|uniref:Uncharacterized protein n=1 Tax=Choristoneura fumiferana TaxID=7141 RepID=A0ACC0KJ50_CHOFU|nr:hypothetical protein MSG28_004365 [Choristoneura fumiferana]
MRLSRVCMWSCCCTMRSSARVLQPSRFHAAYQRYNRERTTIDLEWSLQDDVCGRLLRNYNTFANGLPDSLGKVKKLFADVGDIKLPGVLDDAFNSLVVVGRVDGAVVNLLIPGLGDLFSNLVIAIGKIFVCILGPDADSHYLCQQDYLSEYGYNDIASCSSASEIIEFYKVKNAKQQVEKFINDYIKGKGVESLTVNEKLIYEHVVAISSLLEKDYTKWDSEDLKKFAFSTPGRRGSGEPLRSAPIASIAAAARSEGRSGQTIALVYQLAQGSPSRHEVCDMSSAASDCVAPRGSSSRERLTKTELDTKMDN